MNANFQNDLIAALREPSIEDAVKTLYQQFFHYIVAQIKGLGGNSDDAADIFQDSILILIDKIKNGQFRGESSLKTYFTAIAKNQWLFECRTRDRRKKRETNYFAAEDKISLPQDSFFNRDGANALLLLMNEVGETCKRILSGYYYEGKSMIKLLDEFDYENEQVLRNKKSKCMKKLKELLQQNTTLYQQLKPLSIYESA